MRALLVLGVLVASGLGAACSGARPQNGASSSGTGDGGSGDRGVTDAGPACNAWQLSGTPVVKLVRSAPDEVAALTERHDCLTDGRAKCFGDLPRQVVVLHRGASEAEELAGVSREGEYVTDIAQGPDAGSIWVLTVKWNAEANQLEPRLSLFGGPDRKHELGSFSLAPGIFPEVDATTPGAGWSYDPRLSTHDVLRVAAHQDLVGVLARNASGTLYADRFRYGEGRLVSSGRAVVALPYRGVLWAINGGSYDVMGWIQNSYRVHAVMSEDGTLYGGVTVGAEGLDAVDTLWGTNWLARLALTPLDAAIVAMVFTVSPEAQVAPLEARLVRRGGESGALFQSLAVIGARRFVTGLSREGDAGRSLLVLNELGSTRRAIATSHGSAALQAISIDSDGALLVGGSWDWSQNPAGLSISGGDRFLSRLPADGGAWDEVNLLAQGRPRSEVRSILRLDDGTVCVGGMTGGPDTHRADSDPSLIQGDGFVECLRLDGSTR